MKKGLLAAFLGKGGGEEKSFSVASVASTVGCAAGAAAGTYGANAIVGRVAALQGKPYAAPIGMLVVGHLLKRVAPALGYGLIGAGSAIATINRMSGASDRPAGDVVGAGAVVERRNAGAVVTNAGAFDSDDDDGAYDADAGAVVGARGFGDAGSLAA